MWHPLHMRPIVVDHSSDLLGVACRVGLVGAVDGGADEGVPHHVCCDTSDTYTHSHHTELRIEIVNFQFTQA